MSETVDKTSGQPEMEGRVEFLQPHDWPQAIDIWESVGMVYPATSPEVSRLFVGDLVPGTVLAYKIGEKAVGVVIAGPRNAGNSLVQRLAVLEKYRNRGIASELLEAAEAVQEARGIEKSEVLVDVGDDELVEWYNKRGYGLEPDDTYDAKGLLKPLKRERESTVDIDSIRIPDNMALHAFMSMFERHMYFNASDSLSFDALGSFSGIEAEKLQKALSESSIAGINNFRVATNCETGLRTPASRWQMVDADDESPIYRRWHSLQGGPRNSNSSRLLLRIQDYAKDPDIPLWKAKAANITADGYYVVCRTIREVHGPRVLPFQIENGKLQMLDEETANWMLRTLVESANYHNASWPASRPTVRPIDVMSPEQKRKLAGLDT